jgi:hypothetical protein
LLLDAFLFLVAATLPALVLVVKVAGLATGWLDMMNPLSGIGP